MPRLLHCAKMHTCHLEASVPRGICFISGPVITFITFRGQYLYQENKNNKNIIHLRHFLLQRNEVAQIQHSFLITVNNYALTLFIYLNSPLLPSGEVAYNLVLASCCLHNEHPVR